jgi:hypothetical protein
MPGRPSYQPISGSGQAYATQPYQQQFQVPVVGAHGASGSQGYAGEQRHASCFLLHVMHERGCLLTLLHEEQ